MTRPVCGVQELGGWFSTHNKTSRQAEPLLPSLRWGHCQQTFAFWGQVDQLAWTPQGCLLSTESYCYCALEGAYCNHSPERNPCHTTGCKGIRRDIPIVQFTAMKNSYHNYAFFKVIQINGSYFCVWFWVTMPMIQSPSTTLCQECKSFRPHDGLCLLAAV